MPYISMWIHFVWSTKNREPFLKNGVRKKVFDHIRSNAKQKKIFLDRVNGYHDHVHCLVSLSSDQTIEKVAQLIKGESSFWINKQKLIPFHFGWQDEYFAVSVSQSQVEKVRAYIDNQEAHHKKKTYQEEYDEFMKKYGFKKIPPAQ